MTTMTAKPGDKTNCGMAGCEQVAIMNKDGSRVCTQCVMRRMMGLINRDRRRMAARRISLDGHWRFDPLMGI